MIARYLTATVLVAAFATAPSADAASSFYITGGGDGHGIGMSQYGAYGYAQHGESYRFILAHYFQGTSIGSTNPNWTMRVLLSVGQPRFDRANYIHSIAPGTNQWKKLSTSQTYSLKLQSNGALGLYGQSGSKIGAFTPPVRTKGPGPLNLAGYGLYRDAFEFRPAAGQIQTVNAVPLESYVRGVVSGEMPASWSAQALEAQAVAARTYAITTSVGGNGYSLYSDTRSQMYRGVAGETPSTDAAVSATRAQVVTYQGKPVTTYYFASSGGYTESVQNVWLGSTPEPWLRGVPDPYDGAGGDPYHHWSKRLSMSSAASRLGSLVRGSFQGITVTKRGVSPRVVSASVIGSGGKTSVSGPQLQGIFGLMSTYMSFSTISTKAGTARDAGVGSPAAAAAAVFEAMNGHIHALHGRVLPAGRGAVVGVERLVRGRWRVAVRRVRLDGRGEYSVRLARAGRYRVVYEGMRGPVVKIG